MGVFFIDTSSGRVATQRQLLEAGIAVSDQVPSLPWLRIQGTSDASTLWYAILRRRERGVWIGTLVMRHSDHHRRLLEDGWQEVAVEEIAAPPPRTSTTPRPGGA